MNIFNHKISDKQLDKISQVYRAELSPELREYIRAHPNTKLTENLTWKSDPELILKAQYDMFESVLRFDIEECYYWPKVMGAKPGLLSESVDKALSCIKELPPLIPIDGMKYFVPTQTSSQSSLAPVISFQQFSDTIYAFANIKDFLSEKWLDDKTRQEVPTATGWRDVVDGLGATDENLYIDHETI